MLPPCLSERTLLTSLGEAVDEMAVCGVKLHAVEARAGGVPCRRCKISNDFLNLVDGQRSRRRSPILVGNGTGRYDIDALPLGGLWHGSPANVQQLANDETFYCCAPRP